MSLLMFSSMALVPVSMAVSGALVQISLNGVLIVGGVGMAVLALIGLLSASVRRMGLEPTRELGGAAVEAHTTAEIAPAA
jgi:hypothetical protein